MAEGLLPVHSQVTAPYPVLWAASRCLGNKGYCKSEGARFVYEKIKSDWMIFLVAKGYQLLLEKSSPSEREAMKVGTAGIK